MNPFQILGIQQNASEEEAKLAFRKLAKTCHPDLHPNDPDAERRFKEINAAYDMICKGETQEQPNFNFYEFRTSSFEEFSPFGDIFREIRRRNQDTHLAVVMTMEETFHGKELNVSVNNRTVKAQVPPGVMNGMRIQVSNGGAQNNATLPPGDLFITIRVKPHDTFRRENNHLVMTVPVTVFDVLLKKEIEIINIEGKILKMALSGSRVMRLAGQGMPDPMNKARGDLLVELAVQYPEELTETQRDLIEKAANNTAEI